MTEHVSVLFPLYYYKNKTHTSSHQAIFKLCMYFRHSNNHQIENIMFLHKLLILFLIIVTVHSSPFPDQMLHSNDENTVLYNLQTLGYETTQIPKQQQVIRQIPLHTLMPHACKFSKIDSVSRFPQYGLVGFQSETYTQRYFPQGRYYKNICEYDQQCICPYTREIVWDPEITWTTLQSGEALNKNNGIEVIKFKTNFFFSRMFKS